MIATRGTIAPGLTAKLSFTLDLAILIFSLFASLWLSHGRGPLDPGLGFGPIVSVCIGVWAFTSTALRHYDPGENRSAFDEVAMVTILVFATLTVLAVLGVIVPKDTPFPSPGYFLLVALPTLIASRMLVRRFWAPEAPTDEVLIVGAGSLGRVTAEDLESARLPRNVRGFLSLPGDKKDDVGSLGTRHMGSVDQLASCLTRYPINEVFFAAGNPSCQQEAVQLAIQTCETYGVSFALPACGYRLGRARLASSQAAPDGYVHFVNFELKRSQLALKRLFDIVSSAVAIWVLLPLFAAVAGLIKLTSKGPVFFRQARVGLNGKQFNMLKFRSMVVNAEQLKEKLQALNEQTGPVFKMKNDPRITWIGRFIRKYSIDELPQLINVLRGDMSVVGPRPPVPSEVTKYEPWQRRRLSVRPGLTCIWQVSGRNQISFLEWMYLDMRYIDHWSLSQDFDLILKTVPVVLTGRGAS